MVEQTPVADGRYEMLDVVLHHEPGKRRSHTLGDVLLRKRAFQWRERIACSLMGSPTDLACWRWTDTAWPLGWEQIRQRPLWTAFKRLAKGSWQVLCDQWRTERRLFPVAAVSGSVHHALICFEFWRLRRAAVKRKPSTKLP
jgi:hypothetical protein